jgi:hypothetical protein
MGNKGGSPETKDCNFGEGGVCLTMISDELKSILIQILTSWQVIVVTVGLVFYFSLVSYIAQFHRRLGAATPKPKKEKKEKTAASEEEEDAVAEA